MKIHNKAISELYYRLKTDLGDEDGFILRDRDAELGITGTARLYLSDRAIPTHCPIGLRFEVQDRDVVTIKKE